MQIKKKHALGQDEARRRVESAAGSLAQKYGARTEWQGDDLAVKANGLDGRISVGDEDVTVEAKLGFALKMLESQIKRSIEEALDEHLD